MTLPASIDPATIIPAFVDLVGRQGWQGRMAELKRGCRPTYAGRALAQRHAIELTVDRLLKPGRNAPLTEAESCVAYLSAEILAAEQSLGAAGKGRLVAALRSATEGLGTLIKLFHLARAASLQKRRGFEVSFTGLDDDATFDLLLWRDGAEAELVCDVMSAEAGRDVHRGAWFQLMDRVDPDLQSWLATHPGRYLLKLTLPHGLKGDDAADPEAPSRLAALHKRITALLASRSRADHDEAAILRLDPLILAAAQATEQGLMPRLRREFGPEAHLAVTSSGGGVFVMAARAGREDEVARAVHARMAEIAPVRLTGTRPGILAMFIEDTDRLEWGLLRDQLRLEGEARHFMTRPEAKAVVCVTCASRQELVQCVLEEPASGGEMRFRNPGHPQAKEAALAPAVLSCS